MPKVVKSFVEDEELQKVCNKVITDKKMDELASVKIKCLFVNPCISKSVAARCIKPSKELSYFGKMDYLMEFSQDVWDKIDEKTREILVWHELLHIEIYNDENENTQYGLRKHDVMDFYRIIKEHGIDWLSNFRMIVASIYDLDPKQKDAVRI